jgi:crotonobetainyl-CoA:carnitine CoA-transferase CaiB-like acyl-CoA transferase
MAIFSNLKVIELSSVLAGPAVGAFFAELGANVIKIEPPGGDVTRTWKTPSESATATVSAYYSSVNWGKQCMVLNLKNNTDYEKLVAQIKNADVVISNYKVGDDQKLRVAYEDFAPLNPRLIYAHITGYGTSDPRAGYDAVVQAEAGFMYLNGAPDGPPTKMPVALMDLMAAHQLKEAILVALYNRTQTGAGCRVAVSLLDAGLASLANQSATWLAARVAPTRIGSEHPSIAPYGSVFDTRDGQQIILAVGNDKQFGKLCAVLDRPDLPADARFATNPERVKHRDALLQLLRTAIVRFDRDELLRHLHRQEVPAGAVHTVPQACALPAAARLMLHDPVTGMRGLRTIAFEGPADWQQERLGPPPPLPQG